MSRYPYLLFDADNTLFDFTAAEQIAFRRTCEKNNIPWSEENYATYKEINAALWADFDRGLYEKSFVVVERFRRLLAHLGIAGDADACMQVQEDTLGECSMLIDGAEELCRKLSETHKLYLVTNAVAAVQKRRLAASTIKQYLGGAFISEDAGAATIATACTADEYVESVVHV